MTLNCLIKLECDIVNDLTNKTIVVFKNHRANKSEVAMIQDVDSMNIGEVFCNWIRTQSSELKTIFKVYKVDRWIIDVVIDKFPTFVNKHEYTDYDGLYLEDIGHIGLMISKRKTEDKDIILCDDNTTIYEIALTHQNLFNGGIRGFSMTFTSVDNVKTLN
jgi:hypothetical protein